LFACAANTQPGVLDDTQNPSTDASLDTAETLEIEAEETASLYKSWLMEEMNVADWYKSVFGSDAELPPETAEQTKILDKFYNYYFESRGPLPSGISREDILLREYNICVAATEKFGDKYYSVIPVYNEGGQLFLVSHTDPSSDDIEIVDIIGGHFTLSSGLYPNIMRSFDRDIFWGESLYERLGIDPNTGHFDIRVPNDFTAIEFTMESGDIKTIDITTPGIVLLFFEGDHIVSCKILNNDGEVDSSFNYAFDSEGGIDLFEN